jgi:hypothetical protein
MTRGKPLVEKDVDTIKYFLELGFSSHWIGIKMYMPQRTVISRMKRFGLKSRFKPHVQKKKIKEKE